MTSFTNEVAITKMAAEFKGRMVSLTVLELHGSDLEELNRQISNKATQAPKFFCNAPLLLDFEHLGEEVSVTWFENLCKLLTSNHFIPVGITGASESLEYAARQWEIAVWPAVTKDRKADVPEPQEPDERQGEIEEPKQPQPIETSRPDPAETMVIRQPIRSGQKVHARGGDLIVLSSVSTGAEILADGHIHVYGTLRGRALAGVQGMRNARIFCRDLQADLVAIAGFYVISEDLPKDKLKTAVQIYLEKEQLQIESL